MGHNLRNGPQPNLARRLGIGFAAGVFLGPRPPSQDNVLRVRVMQAERDADLLRKQVALYEAQLAEINAVLAEPGK